MFLVMSADLDNVDLFSRIAPDLKFLVVSFNVLRDAHNTHLMAIRREIFLFLFYIRQSRQISITVKNNYMKDHVLD